MSARAPTNWTLEAPLSSIRVLYRAPDSLTLWGIPYDLRPGQEPRKILERFRQRGTAEDWIYLGEPGWFGSLPAARVREIKEFLRTHKEYVPGNSYEWSPLPRSADLRSTDGRSEINKSLWATGFRPDPRAANAYKLPGYESWRVDMSGKRTARLEKRYSGVWRGVSRPLYFGQIPSQEFAEHWVRWCAATITAGRPTYGEPHAIRSAR